jgi:hypothetical protein
MKTLSEEFSELYAGFRAQLRPRKSDRVETVVQRAVAYCLRRVYPRPR